MRVLIIDNGTKHLGKLKELLFGNELKITPLFRRYEDSENYDLIVLSGGSIFSVHNAPEIFKEEINLTLNTNTPLVGICEGCEIVARAFGCNLQYLDKKAKGLKLIKVVKKNRIFNDIKFFKAYEAHRYSILELNSNLEGLAKSSQGYEVIKHKSKNIYGLQFHPEMLADKSLGDDIFRRIVSTATH